MSVVNDGDVTEGLLSNSTESPPYMFDDYTQRAIVASLTLLAALVAFTGNSLVILAVLLSLKLRTATNAFVVNLSVADLLTSLAIPWNAVALLGTDGLPVSEWVCKVVGIVQFTTIGCSIWTLAWIGVNRLLLITRPTTTYRVMYTPKKIALWIVVTWLFPLVISLTPPLAGVGAIGYNSWYHYCGSIPTHPSYSTYNLIIATALYPIPLVTIFVSYLLIWRHLYRHAKKLTKSQKNPVNPATGSVPMVSKVENRFSTTSDQLQLPASSGTFSSSQRSSRQNEVTKNMLYVVFGFGLCLTPYALNLFINDRGPGIPYTTTIVFINSCINPLIYATKHRDFKTVFGCILRRKWDQIPRPSNFLKTMKRLKCCGGSG